VAESGLVLALGQCSRPHSLQHPAVFLAKNKLAIVPHHSYLPNLTPCDFSVYPWMKQYLKGWHFADVAEVQ
jgi:hypothetical protein